MHRFPAERAEAGLKPRLTRGFKVLKDPMFEAKVSDIVGLYPAARVGGGNPALGPVEIQCELMRAATAWIIAANEVSVMSARRALRLNSLSLQIEGSPATGSRQCPKLPDAVPAFGKLQVDGQGGATSRVLGNADHRTAFVHRRNDPIAVEGVAIGARTNGAPMATRPVSHRT